MKKNKAKIAILCSIMGIFILGFILNFSIEPADYKKSISKQIVKANKLLQDANIGNDNDQYSENYIKELENYIKDAEVIVADENTLVDEEKECFNNLKKYIDEFKNKKNNNSISKDDVEKIKSSNEEFSKEIKIDDNTYIKWNIKGEDIKNVEPINLQVEKNSVYSETAMSLIKDENIKSSLFSFRHNGQLPGLSTITIENNNKLEEVFLYHYDEKNNILVFQSNGEVKDDKLSFVVDKGGDWIITDKILDKYRLQSEKDNKNPDEKKKVEESNSKDEIKNSTDKVEESKPSIGANNENGNKPSGSGENSSSSGNNNSNATKAKYCTIEIRCDTILNNMDKLTPGIDKYVPNNGVILASTRVEILDGETVFEVLKKVVRNKKIQMEFRNDPVYGGAYIKGINHIYEKACGSESGWMYKVNGIFPNYGCEKYTLKDGDKISWVYTCNLGKDVGDQYYD